MNVYVYSISNYCIILFFLIKKSILREYSKCIALLKISLLREVFVRWYLLTYGTYTGWNDKIVVLKKTLQLYFKTFIKKINSANLIM